MSYLQFGIYLLHTLRICLPHGHVDVYFMVFFSFCAGNVASSERFLGSLDWLPYASKELACEKLGLCVGLAVGKDGKRTR